MFNRQSIDFSIVRTSSKEALLRTALLAANNDIKEAGNICDYVLKMLPNMPEREPEQPTILNQLDGVSDWLSTWSEKHPDITNTIGSVLMNALKNSRFGAFLKPAAEVVQTVTETPPPIA